MLILRSIVIFLFVCFLVLVVLYIALARKTKHEPSVSGFKKFYSSLPSLIHGSNNGSKIKSVDDEWGEEETQDKSGSINTAREITRLEEEIKSLRYNNQQITSHLKEKESELSICEKKWSAAYKNLESENEKLQDDNGELNARISKLTAITGKLYPISEYEVAIPFCNFFDELNGILNRAVVSALNLSIQSYSDLQISDFLTLINIEEDYLHAEPIRWYTLLKSTPAVSMVAAKDIVTKTSEEQLLYLKKHLFLECLRPRISQTLLFLDKTRAHLIHSHTSTSEIDSIIDDCVSTLNTYDITVIHYNTYDILITTRYDLLEIKNAESSQDGNDVENRILSIVKYGVNADFLGENDDKTILEMKI